MSQAPKVNRKFCLTYEIDRSDGSKLRIHSTPISRVVFEEYFIVISQTFDAIYSRGLVGSKTAPRTAALMLRKVAKDLNMWDGTGGVHLGLFNEIVRLTNIFINTPDAPGWQMMAFYDACRNGTLDEDEIAEVEGIIVFFTCGSYLHGKNQLPIMISGLALWGAQVSPLQVTEYINSLQISTQEENSSEKKD